jgi:cyanophycin synthetase
MSNGEGAIMELWRLRVLRGPNVWAASPVIEAGVDISAWAGQPRQRSAQARECLRTWLPALENVEENAHPASVLARLWLHLQILAGNAVSFSDTRPGNRVHRYRVAVAYQEEPVGQACLHAALALCRATWEGRPFAVAEEIARLRALAAEQRLEPSALALVEAARARCIPVDHFNPADKRYLLLGQGARQRRTLATETDDVSALTRCAASDKHLTAQLLRDAGVPVPAEAGKLGLEHRVLVVEDRVVAVAHLDPPHPDHGGRPCDVTDTIHPETAACAVAAAQALRLRVAGIDLVATDIARPLEEQGGGIVGIHTAPSLELHLAPWNDHPRPVGAAIVASLFPYGCDGRIPIIAVTGGRAPAAGQCLAALLTDAGYRVGRACRDGVFLAGRKINLDDATASEKTRAVLRNPLVDVAVLEADALDLMREGFGCDRCDVVLVTDREDTGDAPRVDAEEASEAWTAVLHALAPDGKAVLNAEEPPSLASDLPCADRLIWFAETGDNARLSSHRAAGGPAVFLCGDSLVVARGALEQRLPFGGRPVEREPREQLALLAALAGAMSLNLCGDEKPTAPAPVNTTLEAALSTV